jgi:hypothetical protein
MDVRPGRSSHCYRLATLTLVYIGVRPSAANKMRYSGKGGSPGPRVAALSVVRFVAVHLVASRWESEQGEEEREGVCFGSFANCDAASRSTPAVAVAGAVLLSPPATPTLFSVSFRATTSHSPLLSSVQLFLSTPAPLALLRAESIIPFDALSHRPKFKQPHLVRHPAHARQAGACRGEGRAHRAILRRSPSHAASIALLQRDSLNTTC